MILNKKEHRLYKAIFVDGKLNGSRMSERTLKQVMTNIEFAEAIETLFIEVPPLYTFGENDLNRYFLLKKKYQIIKNIDCFISLSIKHPFKMFRYMKSIYYDIKNIDNRTEYYLNPNK